MKGGQIESNTVNFINSVHNVSGKGVAEKWDLMA